MNHICYIYSFNLFLIDVGVTKPITLEFQQHQQK